MHSKYNLFYKNNFIRTIALIFAKKSRTSYKARFAVPQNIRIKRLGEGMGTN